MAETTPVVAASKGADQSDPSPLATQSLWREIANLKSLSDQRMDAIERAVDVSHQDLVRVPTEVQKAIAGLKELYESKFGVKFEAVTAQFIELEKLRNEKFASLVSQIADAAGLRDEKFRGVQKQFEERDTRVDQSARDTKTAVDAALAAQEKAFVKQSETFAASTAKTEESFTKQIDQLRDLGQVNTKSLDDKISELKDRFNRGEGRGEGVDKTRTIGTHNNQWAIITTIMVVGIALAAMQLIIVLRR